MSFSSTLDPMAVVPTTSNASAQDLATSQSSATQSTGTEDSVHLNTFNSRPIHNSFSEHHNTADYFEVDNLVVSFGNTAVVQDLSLKLKRGDIGCLLGLSGCGKTTALRAIAGLELPKHGKINLNNKTITAVSNNTLITNIAPAKRSMGMVFQDYALFNHLSVYENIGFGLHKWSNQERHTRIMEMLELVDLSVHANKKISELSGGQQQRIALARALAPKPELLLLDEPFSNLDMMLRESLATKVRDILKLTNTTAILVTHDQHEAFAIADKIGVMHEGSITQWATPDELYHRPVSPFVAEFIGEGAMINGVVRDGCIHTAIGDIPPHGVAVHESDYGTKSSGTNSTNMRQTIEQTTDANGISFNECIQSAISIKVLVRPDDIVHDDNSPLKAKVIGRVFRGANYLYHLQLDNGEEVLSLIPSHHDHNIGTKIGFRPIMAHVILFSNSSIEKAQWRRIWL